MPRDEIPQVLYAGSVGDHLRRDRSDVFGEAEMKAYEMGERCWTREITMSNTHKEKARRESTLDQKIDGFSSDGDFVQ